MATVEELVVKAVPEGISETVDGINNMERAVEESTESMDEQASALGDLSEKFSGAIGAAVAGLATGAAGLASQVPVIGQAFEGLFAVVQAVAFQLNGVLRPVINPITNGLFRLAGAIFELDGAAGDAAGVIGGLIGVLTSGVVAFAGAKIASLGFVAGLKATASAIGTALTALGSFIASIISLPALLAAVIVATVAFAAAYLTNWKGMRDKTDAIVAKIKDIIVNGFNTFKTKAVKALSKFVSKAKSKFNTIRDNAAEKLGEIVSDATQFGKDLVSNFAAGIRDRISDAVDAASDLASAVRDRLPGSPAETGPLSDLGETGPGLVNTFASGIDNNVGTIKQSSEGLAEGAQPAASALDRQGGRTILEIEGRQVERATRDFRSDGTDLRGRYG
jgi:archaellum component FlaC